MPINSGPVDMVAFRYRQGFAAHHGEFLLQIHMEPAEKEIQIVQTLPKQFVRPVELVPYSAAIVSKKHAHKVSGMLRELHQPHEFEFLKRVRPAPGDAAEILLCKKDNEIALEQIRKALGDLLLEVVSREVPRWAPLTKAQHKEWSEHWPTAFSQNDFEIIKHTKKEVSFLGSLVRQMGEDDFILFTLEDGELLRARGGCPKGSILHGVMRLLQDWPQSETFNRRKHNTRSEDHEEYPHCEQYYYLTGIFLLARQKVCQMCAMALLHSRLRRLYYMQPCEQHDIDDIAYNKRLNHQYSLIRLS